MSRKPEQPSESPEEVDYEPHLNQLKTETSAFGILWSILAWRIRVPQWFIASFWLSMAYSIASLLLQNSWKVLVAAGAAGVVMGIVIAYFTFKKTDTSLPVIGGRPVNRRTHTVSTVSEVMLMSLTILTAASTLIHALLS